MLVIDICFYNRHPVLCQRPGLVRTDYGCTAQCLNGRKRSYYGITLYHPLNTHCKDNGRHCRQPFGDGRNSQAHCSHEHADHRITIENTYHKYDSAY